MAADTNGKWRKDAPGHEPNHEQTRHVPNAAALRGVHESRPVNSQNYFEVLAALDARNINATHQVEDEPLTRDFTFGVDLCPRHEYEAALMGARMRQDQVFVVGDALADHDEVDVKSAWIARIVAGSPERSR